MSRLDAWWRWQAAAGPWRGYAVCPSLQVGFTPSPSSSQVAAVPSLENLLAIGPTALLLDLDPVLGVQLGAHLSRERLAHVVLMLPRWPHADAVLPCDELIATLHATSRWLTTDPRAPHVVFVLDGERGKSIRRRRQDSRVDNRYDLSPGDLPGLQTLRAAGIQRVVKLTHRE